MQSLLIRGPRAAYGPSPYVDAHGEEDPGLRRGKPLFLHARCERARGGGRCRSARPRSPRAARRPAPHGKPSAARPGRRRMAALEDLWLSHGVAAEIVRIRSTSERVIRNSYY